MYHLPCDSVTTKKCDYRTEGQSDPYLPLLCRRHKNKCQIHKTTVLTYLLKIRTGVNGIIRQYRRLKPNQTSITRLA